MKLKLKTDAERGFSLDAHVMPKPARRRRRERTVLTRDDLRWLREFANIAWRPRARPKMLPCLFGPVISSDEAEKMVAEVDRIWGDFKRKRGER